MNPAITAALMAAQQSAALDPVTRLGKAGALTSATAIAIAAPSEAEQKLIDRAIGDGLIQRRADGRLYLNQRAVDARNARLGTTIIIATLVGLSIMASVVALLLFAR